MYSVGGCKDLPTVFPSLVPYVCGCGKVKLSTNPIVICKRYSNCERHCTSFSVVNRFTLICFSDVVLFLIRQMCAVTFKSLIKNMSPANCDVAGTYAVLTAQCGDSMVFNHKYFTNQNQC